MRITKIKQKQFIDDSREAQLKEYEYNLKRHDYCAIVCVPLSFKENNIKPQIEGTEHGQGWQVLLTYWDNEKNEAWAKVGIYKEVI